MRWDENLEIFQMLLVLFLSWVYNGMIFRINTVQVTHISNWGPIKCRSRLAHLCVGLFCCTSKPFFKTSKLLPVVDYYYHFPLSTLSLLPVPPPTTTLFLSPVPHHQQFHPAMLPGPTFWKLMEYYFERNKVKNLRFRYNNYNLSQHQGH